MTTTEAVLNILFGLLVIGFPACAVHLLWFLERRQAVSRFDLWWELTKPRGEIMSNAVTDAKITPNVVYDIKIAPNAVYRSSKKE